MYGSLEFVSQARYGNIIFLTGQMNIKNVVLAAAMVVSSAASAAMGPYVVWVNLAQQPAGANLKVRAYLGSETAPCWDIRTSLFFIRERPQGISDDLATRALINGDEAAKDKLNAILKTPFGVDAIGGFDGIMLYTDKPAPRLYSMGIDDRTVKAADIGKSTGSESLESRLCGLMPAVKRKIPLRNKERLGITR